MGNLHICKGLFNAEQVLEQHMLTMLFFGREREARFVPTATLNIKTHLFCIFNEVVQEAGCWPLCLQGGFCIII